MKMYLAWILALQCRHTERNIFTRMLYLLSGNDLVFRDCEARHLQHRRGQTAQHLHNVQNPNKPSVRL